MSKITKKQLQHSIDLLNKENNSQHDYLMRIKRALKSIDIDILSDEFDEPKTQLKQLDQSIFDALEEKWRFAAVDTKGGAFLFAEKPSFSKTCIGFWFAAGAFGCKSMGYGYDTTNWQDSLIERNTAKELTGSELCKAMLARGDKCVLIRMGVRDDKQAKEIGRFAIATSIDESGRFNVMSDQQPISKVDFAIPINNQGEPLTASEVGL